MKTRLFYSFIFIISCCFNVTGQETIEQIQSRQLLEQVQKGEDPDTIEAVFDRFCNAFYGAERDPLVYEKFGNSLQVKGGSFWKHISENSASIAWSTNLPAKSYIEYGLTSSYGNQTSITDRHYYTHLHQLKNLILGSTYHYRTVSEDERGNIIYSSDSTFITRTVNDVVYIPGSMGSPPYLLNQKNTTYVLTQDIVADRTAMVILADSVTLDLNGYTITHGNATSSEKDESDYTKFSAGVYARSSGQSGLKVFNGAIKNGAATTNSGTSSGYGFNPFYIKYQSEVEIAGVNVEYYFSQTHGVAIVSAAGDTYIHHNLINDKGNIITYRHGAGVKSILFRGGDPHIENGHKLEYNLIKRTRQNGFNFAMKMYENEVYVDSWATNSFAIQPTHKSAHIKGNKVFLTGYNAYGSGWSSNDMIYEDNLIHMESIITMTGKNPYTGNRYFETWGDIDCLAGLRMTNYNPGGRVRNNLLYRNNTIIGNCRGGAEMRGTQLMTDYSINNTRVEDSQIKVMVTDSNINNRAACIVAHGAGNDSLPIPLFYTNCKLISNFCNIRFGDSYSRGHNHRFHGCEIIKEGAHPDYHTFVFDGSYFGWDHQLIDCDFLSGAIYNDVYWKRTGAYSNYSLGYTFCINGNIGTVVTVIDALDSVRYTKIIPAAGVIDDTLLYSTIRPTNWTPTGGGGLVNDRYNYQEIVYSPYKILWDDGVISDSLMVDLDSSKCVILNGQPTGIHNIKKSTISVYPNPTEGLVMIKGFLDKHDVEISVFNLLGDEIAGKTVLEGSSAVQFDITHLPKGVYFLIVGDNNQKSVHKILKN